MKQQRRGWGRRAMMAAGLVAMLLGAADAMAAKQPPATPVDLNTAGVSELMTIPGVGPAKAQAIVAYRQATPFASTDDLANVKGIGQKMLAKIAPYIAVSGKTQGSESGTAEKAAR